MKEMDSIALPAFPDTFAEAFYLTASSANGDPSGAVSMFVAKRTPTISDTAPDGSMWLDESAPPYAVFTMMPATSGSGSEWVLSGEFAVPVTSRPSARLWRAALLRAGRWWLITKAPLGVLEGDMGSIYVSRFDSEADSLLRGYRGRRVPIGQTWPSVEDVVSELMNTTRTAISTSRLAGLEQALAAAVEWVVEECEGGML